MRDDVDVGPGELRTHRAVAVEDLQHALGQVGGEQFGEPAAGVRAALAGLVDDGVAGDQRGAEQARGDGDGVVPGGQHGDDAARARHHEVGGVPAAVQGAPAVHGPQLGVLHQRADPGVDPAPRVVERLAGLALGEGGELVGGVPDGRRGGVQRGGPFGGRGVGPAVGGEAGPAQGPLALVRGGDRDAPDGLAGARVQDGDLTGQHIGHTCRYPFGTALYVP